MERAMEARRLALRLRASQLLREYDVIEKDTGVAPPLRGSWSLPERRGEAWQISSSSEQREQSMSAGNQRRDRDPATRAPPSVWSLSVSSGVARLPAPKYERPAPPRATTALLVASRRMLTADSLGELAAVTALSRAFRSDRALRRTVAKIRRHCPAPPFGVLATTLPGNDAQVHVAWSSGDAAPDGTAIQSYTVEADPSLPAEVRLDAADTSVLIDSGSNADAPERTFRIVAHTAAGYRAASLRVSVTRSPEKLWVALKKTKIGVAARASAKKKKSKAAAAAAKLDQAPTFSDSPRLKAHFAARAKSTKEKKKTKTSQVLRPAPPIVPPPPRPPMLVDAFGGSWSTREAERTRAAADAKEAQKKIEVWKNKIAQRAITTPPFDSAKLRPQVDHLAERKPFDLKPPRPCIIDEFGTTFLQRENATKVERRRRRAKVTTDDAQRDLERIARREALAEQQSAERQRRMRAAAAKRRAKELAAAAPSLAAAARARRTGSLGARARAAAKAGSRKSTVSRVAGASKKKVKVKVQAKKTTRAAPSKPATPTWHKDSRGSWIGTGNKQTHPSLKSKKVTKTTTTTTKTSAAMATAATSGAARDAYGRRRIDASKPSVPKPKASAPKPGEAAAAAAAVPVAASAAPEPEPVPVAAAAASELEPEPVAMAAASAPVVAVDAAQQQEPEPEASPTNAEPNVETESEVTVEIRAEVELLTPLQRTLRQHLPLVEGAAEEDSAAAEEEEVGEEVPAATAAAAEEAGEEEDAEEEASAAVKEEGEESAAVEEDYASLEGCFVGPHSNALREEMIYLTPNGECTWSALDFAEPEEGEGVRGMKLCKSKAHGTWSVEDADVVLLFASKTTEKHEEEPSTETFEEGSEEKYAVPLDVLQDEHEWRRQ